MKSAFSCHLKGLPMSNRIAATVCLTLGLIAPTVNASARPGLTEVGDRFRKTCMHCHQSPDVRFATDRVWLDQVRRTA